MVRSVSFLHIQLLLQIGAIIICAQESRRCPLCDSSVFGYCSDKLLHDACCCSPFGEKLPYQCHFADCSFLHANSCREHKLITACCCDKLLLINS